MSRNTRRRYLKILKEKNTERIGVFEGGKLIGYLDRKADLKKIQYIQPPLKRADRE